MRGRSSSPTSSFRRSRPDAVYQNAYPLATALARPLIAKILVDYARREGASAVAHGCTGKGNDQVRFDVSIQALAPELKIIAPVREWRMTRDDEIGYAQQHDIPVPVTASSPYSVDANLWGRSVEAGVLEDPWNEPPEDAYAWTIEPRFAPEEPTYVDDRLRARRYRCAGRRAERTERLTRDPGQPSQRAGRLRTASAGSTTSRIGWWASSRARCTRRRRRWCC